MPEMRKGAEDCWGRARKRKPRESCLPACLPGLLSPACLPALLSPAASAPGANCSVSDYLDEIPPRSPVMCANVMSPDELAALTMREI